MEFLLHGLSEFSQVSKSYLDNGYAFKDMLGSLFNARFDDEDDEDFDNQ
jgi:magnesium chelatase subunit I